MISPDDIDTIFDLHPPTEEQMTRMGVLRKQCKDTAQLMIKSCPQSVDLDMAIRYVDIALRQAIAAIVRYEPDERPVEKAAKVFSNTLEPKE